jgi:hypothetical protein
MTQPGANSAEALVKLLAGLGRTDVYCEFDVKGRGYRTRKAPLSEEVVTGHVIGRRPIAIYPAVRDHARIAVLDFDNHHSELTFEEMSAGVLPLVHDLIAIGLRPLAFRSGGGAGIHILLIWKEPQKARSARRLLTRIAARNGLKIGTGGLKAGQVEIYPKQDSVENDQVGSAIALPLARLSVPLDHTLTPIINREDWRWPLENIFSPAIAEENDGEQGPARRSSPSSGHPLYLNEVLEGDLAEAEAALRCVTADQYDVWIQIGFTLKHSFGEKGFALWDAWSRTATTKYPGTAECRRIWDGLKPRGALGLGTLFHKARENGWNGPSRPTIREMNARFGILTYANKTMIIVKDGDRHPDDEFPWLSKAAFLDRLAGEKIPVEAEPGATKLIGKAAYWLKHAEADHYHRLDFDPSLPPGRNGKSWNTWSGFGAEPVPGDWSLLQKHILDNICRGDRELYEWILNWMALGVQKPGEPIGTAPILQGLPGTGKGILAHAYGRLWGRHYISVTHQSHVSGRFNAHLLGKRFVFIDEGTFGGNRRDAGVIKTRITEPFFILEVKGVDPMKVRNRMIFMIASNEDSIVAADKGDRRWQVFQVAEGKRGNRAYFAQILRQLEQGGHEAMLHDLLLRDISKGPDPRQVIRNTGLFEQYIRAAPPEMRYLHQVLDNGFLPQPDAPGNAPNATTLRAMHEEMKLTQAGAHYAAPNAFGRTLHQVITGLQTSQSGRYVTGWSGGGPITERSTRYVFPSLQDCRRAFERHIALPVPWSNDLAGWVHDDEAF